MDEREIDQALERVRTMQTLVLDGQGFRGFSGAARMAGGVAAMATALILRRAVAAEPLTQLIGWGALLVFGLAVNFAALAYWLLKSWPSLRLAELWPVWEVFPVLSAGAALSFALIRTGHFDLLFGVWMALYGASHIAYRRSLPFPIYCGGLVYVAAGIFCLLWPGIHFTDPRPMGLVFGLGELFGGWILYRSNHA
jgi:hypothetical protein